MGLFDDIFGGSAKREAVENQILQRMSQLPILDMLVQSLLAEEDGAWLLKSQGYYDNCRRTVTVSRDCFEVKWNSYQQDSYYDSAGNLRTQSNEEIHAKTAYSYTKSGYVPLHPHYNEKGKEDVSLGRVCFLWAAIVRERMMAKMSECNFGPINEYEDYAEFTYTVPGLTFKDWF